jgi:uncharacterized phage-associated protein
MHSAIQVANKILELANAKKDTITPMQMIKLVFMCHGWMLGICGRHLIKDPVEAWKYGPVIPDLYQAVRKFKSNPIEMIPCQEPAKFDHDELQVIEQVYEKYGHRSGIVLSSMTHQKDSPWDIVVNKHNNMGHQISNNLIEDYYHRLYVKNNQPTEPHDSGLSQGQAA